MLSRITCNVCNVGYSSYIRFSRVARLAIKPFGFKKKFSTYPKHEPVVPESTNLKLPYVCFFGIIGYYYYNCKQEEIAKKELAEKEKEYLQLKEKNKQETQQAVKSAEFDIIQKLYNIFNSKQYVPYNEIAILIKEYLCYELNHLLIIGEKLTKTDKKILDSIIVKLFEMYNLVKDQKIFNFLNNSEVFVSFGLTSSEYDKITSCTKDDKMDQYRITAKSIYELDICKHFFKTIYFMNKQYEFMPDYIIIYILDRYLFWSLNLEKGLKFIDIENSLFFKKYEFAYIILDDFINTNVSFRRNAPHIIQIMKKKDFGSNKKYIDTIKQYFLTYLEFWFSFNIDKNKTACRLNYFYYTVFYEYNKNKNKNEKI